MSSLRPSVRVTGPDGREWELYAYRLRLPGRQRVPRRLVGDLLYALERLFVDFPLAALRSPGSDEWTIEAITFGGHSERHAWRTTREFRGQVLASVEGSLAHGDFPVPAHARRVS